MNQLTDQRLSNHRRQVNVLLGRQQRASEAVVDETKGLKTCKEQLTAVVGAQSIVQSIAQSLQQRAHDQIARVVSRCLAAVFERHGQDVFATLEVPMVQAALGAEIEVETLDGVESVRLEPGIESGTTLRLRGQGVPNLGRRGRGDLFLTVQVQTPRDLSKEERKLLEELAHVRDEPAGKRATVQGSLRRPERGR